MAIPSGSLTRLLEKGFLRSLDEEDLECLTVAIVQEVADRRQVSQLPQRDELMSRSYPESSPTLHEDEADSLQRISGGELDEIQMHQVRHAEGQEE